MEAEPLEESNQGARVQAPLPRGMSFDQINALQQEEQLICLRSTIYKRLDDWLWVDGLKGPSWRNADKKLLGKDFVGDPRPLPEICFPLSLHHPANETPFDLAPHAGAGCGALWRAGLQPGQIFTNAALVG